MKTIKTLSGNEIKIFAKTIEESVIEQVTNLADFDAYKNSKIRIMPDCHTGIGCTIGTTMTIDNKITPNLVGVDIGCGMLTIKLKEESIDLPKLDSVIHSSIPSGRSIHREPMAEFDFSNLKRKYELDIKRAKKSIGTLGGGNHFIEVGRNSIGELFLIIHSGSRGIGNEMARLYQKTAINNVSGNVDLNVIIEDLKTKKRFSEIQSAIKNAKSNLLTTITRDLAYLENEYFSDYIHDMKIMQDYASVNRRVMANIILENANLNEDYSFETVHNYIDFKRMILRKGAVSAEKDEKLLIPINMRDGSLICIGKGNKDWNYSAPHGAGRLMSRTQAKSVLKMETFKSQMRDVYSTSVNESTIDESPDAYKSMSEIVELVEQTAAVMDVIKPIYNFKAQ